MTDKYDDIIIIAIVFCVLLFIVALTVPSIDDHRKQLYRKYPECATACKPHVCIRYKERVNNDR